MSRTFLLTFLLTFSFFCEAQTIKLENGISSSSMRSDNISFLNKKITTYSVLVGYEYLNHKYYYLSSAIGYLRKGGQEEISAIGNIKEQLDYLHFNTTIRAKITINDLEMFTGIGPTIDVLLSDKNFKSELFDLDNEKYVLNSVSFGSKIEIGFVQLLNDRFKVGCSGSYLLNIDCIGKSTYNKLKNDTFQMMVTIGYIL